MTTVTNNAAASAATDIRDIKPPIEISSGFEWMPAALAIIVLAVVAFFLWRLWQKRRAQVSIVPPIPAHIRAKQKLQEALTLISQPKEFCILVSDTIRFYLEERFQFRAPERTTEEFLRELNATDLLVAEQKESLGKFLESCDLVKFAKYEPGENELRGLHGSAVKLVEETELREVQSPESKVQSQTPEMPSQIQKHESTKNNRLAIIGVALQLGNSVFFFAYFVGLAKELGLLRDLPSKMAQPNSIDLKHLFDPLLIELNQLQNIWIGVLIASGIGILIGIVGLILMLIALIKQQYRAEWFFWFLIIYSLILFGTFPFGTIFGIFFLVYCLTKRREFLNPK
jgi:hypothetical protein